MSSRKESNKRLKPHSQPYKRDKFDDGRFVKRTFREEPVITELVPEHLEDTTPQEEANSDETGCTVPTP